VAVMAPRRGLFSWALAVVVLPSLCAASACGPVTVYPTRQIGPAEADYPVAWYLLDDPAAMGRDHSGYGRDALPVGIAVSPDPTRGSVAHFDGGSFIAVPTISHDLTITFFLKTSTEGPEQTGWVNGPRIIDADVAGLHPDFGVGVALDRIALGAGYPDDATVDNTSLKSQHVVVDGLWHHVAITRDGDSGIWQLYIDGVLDGTKTGVTGDLTLPKTITVGGLGNTAPASPPLRADLSDLRFYDRTLGAATIAFLATQ
jgi:Concanavalin A-like lectin/glucanases superfamily